MGSVVGERFKRAVDHCIQNKAPLVCFSSSGGARMQEALFSLLQMAKTSAALARLAQARCRSSPCSPIRRRRRLRQSRDARRPQRGRAARAHRLRRSARHPADGARNVAGRFQRSEFLLDHGALDLIVDRRDMRERLGALLRL
jgi:acetyl-CoA carboxylase carboxyl transferase subunit beta